MIKYIRALIIILFLFGKTVYCQSKIAITIDDVPKTKKFEKDNFKSILLNKLDSINVPVTIFVNEGLLYKTKNDSKNRELIEKWGKRNYITLGNHTYNHSRYSNVNVDSFLIDVIKGEDILKELSKQYNKTVKYFRFPYNDLGKDSLQQKQIAESLTKRKYTIAPFTVESSDWVYNYIYEYYLENNNSVKAKSIAHSYIDITLKYFTFFDSISVKQYGRKINHIYLCHDNSLNADYLDVLIKKLYEKGYTFISLDEAMNDKVYKQRNLYYKKWGISWIYRWMNDKKEMSGLMKKEPSIMDIYKTYKEIHNLRNRTKANKYKPDN